MATTLHQVCKMRMLPVVGEKLELNIQSYAFFIGQICNNIFFVCVDDDDVKTVESESETPDCALSQEEFKSLQPEPLKWRKNK